MVRRFATIAACIALLAAAAYAQDGERQQDPAAVWRKRASKALKKLARASERLMQGDRQLDDAETLVAQESDTSQAQWQSLDRIDSDLGTLEERVAANPFADLMPWALGLGAPLLLGGGSIALSLGAKRRKAARREQERTVAGDTPQIVTLRPPNVRRA